jgi:hypothetical protein
MSTPAQPLAQPERGQVRVSRIRGGERCWQVTVDAGGDEAELRAALDLAVALDAELAARLEHKARGA